MSLERLQKVLARSTPYSRRKAEELIAAGRVAINGRVVRRLGVRVDPGRDRITLDGTPLAPNQHKVYLMLNKPRGVLCTLHDPQGRPIVTDLLQGVEERVFPVGRLDMDSEGLVLLTNDGDLALRLQHPRYRVPKTYQVLVEGIPTARQLEKMARGVRLEEGPTAPARVRLLKARGRSTWIEVTITEGRKRQVRRMCRVVGLAVLRLRRVALHGLTLGNLRPGAYRYLHKREVEILREVPR